MCVCVCLISRGGSSLQTSKTTGLNPKPLSLKPKPLNPVYLEVPLQGYIGFRVCLGFMSGLHRDYIGTGI